MSDLHNQAHQNLEARLLLLEGGSAAPLNPITITSPPKLAPDGSTIKEGVPITRETGSYQNGTAIGGARYRYTSYLGNDGVAIAGATAASWTPTADEVGMFVRFHEQVVHNVDGTTITAISAPLGPFLAADAPSSGALETFDFAGATPAAVAIARTGALATRRTGLTTLALVAANLPRWQHDSAGTQIGLLIEKAATNLIANAQNPGAQWSVSGTGVTVTQNYGTGPHGVASKSTRVEVAAGNGYSGITLGVHNVSAARRVFYALKSTGTVQVVVGNENTGEYDWKTLLAGWNIYELQGSGALGSNFMWQRVLSNNGAAIDVEIWGPGVQLGTGLQTLVASDGTNVTRPKEILTLTLATGSVTRDIQITDYNGSVQNFASQVIPSTPAWTLDADDITIEPCIAAITVHADASLGTTPPPSPPPAPPPSGGGPTMSVDALIIDMTTDSVAPVGGSFNGVNRWAKINMPANFAAIVSASNWGGVERTKFDEFVNAMTTWTWMFPSVNNTATGKRLQYRNLRYATKNATVWTEYPLINRMGPNQLWIWSDSQNKFVQTQTSANIREEDDGHSVLFTGRQGIEAWPDGFYLAGINRTVMETITAFCAIYEVRFINDDGTAYTGSDAKGIACLGFDNYNRNRNTTNINGGTSGVEKDGLGYPLNMWDGGSSRWKEFSGADGWVTVGIMPGPASDIFDSPGAPPPFAGAVGGVDWSSPDWPYDDAPYVMTEAEFRANRPSFIV